MRRLLWLLWMMLAALGLGAAPAHADDISAAGRGVVRIVTIATVGDEVVGFGYGSGFAVAPNRVVTNFHVIELATRYPDNVLIGVVPSEGDKPYQGKLIAVDRDHDLALVEFSGGRLPPLTLFSGPVQEGDSLIALGYPGNVDRAVAKSGADYITPQSPVRSQGNLSGLRTLDGTSVLLHTASIAHGNSGGPLLDRCGRVLGVNSAVTNTESGDSTFGFAIAESELGAFLESAKQSYAKVDVPCTSIEEQLQQDRNADEAAKLQADEAARQAAARAASERQSALEQARANAENTRENYIFIAMAMLVFGGLCIGGAGLLYSRERQREAMWVGAGGVVLFIGAVALFLSRPSFDESKIVPVASATGAAAPAAAVLGKQVCTIVPERSRVTVSNNPQVELEVGADGCINGKTQYAEDGARWQRILVPEQEQTVSVLDYDPASGTYSNTRYLLSAEQMKRARELRAAVVLKACSADQAARGNLVTQQQQIRAALPQQYNEKLVYHCAPAR
ncbi:serine protease [Sphingomonas sp.]|uniref:S1C family serine protease n=1 Tax=Sphingomonas sp. TaxID=28214 RepID=UPI001B2C0DC2|nr:serine protease [Sphingomonas sp.]MBO9713215.1 trypsin-like peptidase domain-containing protein [Sphingomonas sp.]